MYTEPYGGASPEEMAGALGAYFGCVMIFTLLFLALYLWLFYRIFKKAGYSGWLTLLNLIPFGSLVVVAWLAFGNWPALQDRSGMPMGGGSAYPPSYPPAGQPPVPPSGPGYQPPAPPMAQAPVYEPQPSVPPAQPPAPQPPIDEQPPAPPTPQG